MSLFKRLFGKGQSSRGITDYSVAMRILFLLLAALLTGCSPNPRSGPKTVSETSASRPKLEDRIAFIEQYVTFTRTYLYLEYDVEYHNNGGGMVPGPSDWDIKILAVVPADEIDEWIPTGAQRTDRNPPSWLNAMPDTISTNEIAEWYAKGNSVVGIDRTNSIIVYRNSTSAID